LDIKSTVDNKVHAALQGSLIVNAVGNVQVLADEDAAISGDATNVSLAFGLGISIGVSLVNHQILSELSASVVGTTLTSQSLTITAGSKADIPITKTTGVAGGLVAESGNKATAIVESSVGADLSASNVAVAGSLIISSYAVNTALAEARGGAFGALAIGAMLAETEIKSQVKAGVGDDTSVTAREMRVIARNEDKLRSESLSAAMGAIVALGADSKTRSTSSTAATIGSGVVIAVGVLEISSSQLQDHDSSARAGALGLAAGMGAAAANRIEPQANVSIGSGQGAPTTIVADTINIGAANSFSKYEYGASGHNLVAGSFSIGSISALVSKTVVNPNAVIEIGDQATLIAVGTNQQPGRLGVQAYNTGKVVDSVRAESVSLVLGMTVGLSDISYHGDAEVKLNGAMLENQTGAISIGAFTDAELRGSANLMVASGLTGAAGADVKINNVTNNRIGVNDATLKGSEITLVTGRSLGGIPGSLEATGYAQILMVSALPGIPVPIVKADIVETNDISIQGRSVVQSLRDVNLISNRGIGDKRAKTSGDVLSLSLVPYGWEIPDKATDKSINEVKVEETALVEAGLNNMTVVRILPVKVNGDVRDDLLPNNGRNILDRLSSSSDVPRVGRRLSDAELAAIDPPLPAGLKYEYAYLPVENIAFTVSPGTIVQVIQGANGGGIVGDYYEARATGASGSRSVFLEKEDFSKTSRWKHLGSEVPEGLSFRPIYPSDVTASFKAGLVGKFFLIKPVEMAAPAVSYVNVGNLLLEQREQVVTWISNHTGDIEALARYEVQLAAIDDSLAELGLTQYFIQVKKHAFVFDVAGKKRYQYLGDDEGIVLAESDFENRTLWDPAGDAQQNGDIPSDSTDGVLVVKRELDTLFLTLPPITASPGSVFIERSSLDAAQQTAASAVYRELVANGRIIARPGSQISIHNESPITTVIRDTQIVDNRTVQVIDGVYTVFDPGNVWFNRERLTDLANTDEPKISITQDSLPIGYYDLSGGGPGLASALGTLEQDMYIVGDIVNETGALTISNVEGSIIVSGTLRAASVDLQAKSNFSLNAPGWFHTNQDPRQYLTFDAQRASAIGQTGIAQVFEDAGLVTGKNSTGQEVNLLEAMQRNDSRILAPGKITITARFLNINGLIQSGVQTVTLAIGPEFPPRDEFPWGRSFSWLQNDSRTVGFTDMNGKVLPGISFGEENVFVDGFFDHKRKAIVVEDIIPRGGEIVLAGQILSTGNGQLKVANGYTNVNITNESEYDLVLSRIDTTTDRKGKITIIDTSRLHKDVYELSAKGVEHRFYLGEAVTQDKGSAGTNANVADGIVQTIVYKLQADTIAEIGSVMYAPCEGLHYVWVEGQSSVTTTRTEWEFNSFNLFGDNALASLLAEDKKYVFKGDPVFLDKQPLLESETIEVVGSDLLPNYAGSSSYTIRHEKIDGLTTEVIKDVTKVFVGGDKMTGKDGVWYLYTGLTGRRDLTDKSQYVPEKGWTQIEDPENYNIVISRGTESWI
jgi:hypothetical protein